MNLNLPLSLYYETCDEDGMVEPYFTGDITDSEGRVICRADSEGKALDLIGGLDDLLANIEALRARLAEVEAQRDGLKNALNFYAEDDADSVECGILESVYHRPATEALAKLEEK